MVDHTLDAQVMDTSSSSISEVKTANNPSITPSMVDNKIEQYMYVALSKSNVSISVVRTKHLLTKILI